MKIKITLLLLFFGIAGRMQAQQIDGNKYFNELLKGIAIYNSVINADIINAVNSFKDSTNVHLYIKAHITDTSRLAKMFNKVNDLKDSNKIAPYVIITVEFIPTMQQNSVLGFLIKLHIELSPDIFIEQSIIDDITNQANQFLSGLLQPGNQTQINSSLLYAIEHLKLALMSGKGGYDTFLELITHQKDTLYIEDSNTIILPEINSFIKLIFRYRDQASNVITHYPDYKVWFWTGVDSVTKYQKAYALLNALKKDATITISYRPTLDFDTIVFTCFLKVKKNTAWFRRLDDKPSNAYNRFGYDECDENNLKDDHISVAAGDSTFVGFMMPANDSIKNYTFTVAGAGSSELSIRKVNKNTLAIKSNNPAQTGKQFMVIAKYKTIPQCTLFVNVYKKIIISNVATVSISDPTSPKTSLTAINSSFSLNLANDFLKYAVVQIDPNIVFYQHSSQFDINKNGYLDYFRYQKDDPEYAILYNILKNLNKDNVVVLKNKIRYALTLAKNVNINNDSITFEFSWDNYFSKFLQEYNHRPDTFFIENLYNSQKELFSIILASGTASITPTSYAVTFKTDKTFSNYYPKDSAYVYWRAQAAGLASPGTDLPVLICSGSNHEMGYRWAHEIMHKIKLKKDKSYFCDLENPGNLMHYVYVFHPLYKRILTFKEQTQAKYNTDTLDSYNNNQWDDIKRN